MFLEMLGVGLIVPVLILMIEPEPLEKYPIFQEVFSVLGTLSQEKMIVFAMISLAIVYMVKAAFLIYLTWRKAYFLTGLTKFFSQTLFAHYLRKDYTYHLENNSADLIRNATSDVKSYGKGMMAILDLITDGLVLFGVLALLLFSEPFATASVLLFLGICSVLLHYSIRNKLSEWGENGRIHYAKGHQHLRQGLSGVKEVKLYAKESAFSGYFNRHNTLALDITRKQTVMSSLPRFIFEILIIIALAGLVFFFLQEGKKAQEIVPFLGLFAASAFRVMPSMVRISTSMQNLRFNKPAIEKLHEEFKFLKDDKLQSKQSQLVKAGSAGEKIELDWKTLTLSNISYIYPNTKKMVLKDINIAVSRKEMVGFIGGSGAGKSTIVDVILGLLTPSNGEVKLGKRNIGSVKENWQSQLGYVPQVIYLTDDTIRRNVAFGVEDNEIDERKLNKALVSAQLLDFVGTLPQGIDTKVGEDGVRLSGGQRQRLGIARALYNDPEVLLLDEATSSLDVETEAGVMSAINTLQGSKTIIIVAHRLTTVSCCDRLYRMENGKVVQTGRYKDIIDV